MLAVLAGLEDAAGVDFRDCGSYIGTSAGSIVSAALVAGVRPSERLGSLPEQPQVSESEEAGGSVPQRVSSRIARPTPAGSAGSRRSSASTAAAPASATMKARRSAGSAGSSGR